MRQKDTSGNVLMIEEFRRRLIGDYNINQVNRNNNTRRRSWMDVEKSYL